MILIDRTFDVITDESAGNGDVAESGFAIQSEPVTFSELVDLMSEHSEASNWPPDGNPREWYTGDSVQNVRNGSWRSESIHYSRKNPEHMAKYWRKAAIFAGLVKA